MPCFLSLSFAISLLLGVILEVYVYGGLVDVRVGGERVGWMGGWVAGG